MYYEAHGTGSPLVLLHGGSATIDSSFGSVLPALAKSRQVIAVEQQGHGHTADIPRPLSYEQMADDTAALLRLLKVEGADLLGWSDGANVALQMALRHPNLVRKLIVSGANYNNAGIDPEAMQWLKATTPDNWPKEFQEAYVRAAPDPKQWPTLINKLKKMWLEFKGWRPEDIQRIEAPVLVIIGDADMVRPEHAVQMFRLLPYGQLAVLPATGHRTLMQRPAWVLSMIAAFLDAPLPGAR
jgi:pimeloyl-ACP methyl ester carboxylesterase